MLSNTGNKTLKLIAVCLLTMGVTFSIAGCLSHEMNAQNSHNITTTNTPPLVQENNCYEINQTSHTLIKYPLESLDQSKRYWIHIDPIADHKDGDVFQITGCANVPEGTQFWGGIF